MDGGSQAMDLGYRAGVCNIGPEEIERRRQSGLVGLGVGAVMAAVLVATGAPTATRWLVAIPLAGSAAGFLQARSRFCAGYGFRGLRGMVGLGTPEIVEDPEARAADRRRALAIGAASGVIGLAGAAVLVALSG